MNIKKMFSPVGKLKPFLVLFILLIIFLFDFSFHFFSKPGRKKVKPLPKEVIEQLPTDEAEWIDALDIKNNKNVIFTGYTGKIGSDYNYYDNDFLAINIYEKNDNIFNKIIKKDTSFIKNNLYIKEKKRKIFHCYSSDSIPKRYYGYKNFIDKDAEHLNINFTKDGLLRVWFTNDILDIEAKTFFSDDIEVLEIFDLGNEIGYAPSINNVKQKLDSLKYIILYKNFPNVNLDDLKNDLKKIYPDVEIFEIEQRYN